MDTIGSFKYGATSFQAQTAYSGIKDVLCSVYKEGGLRGLYRGVGMYCFNLSHSEYTYYLIRQL